MDKQKLLVSIGKYLLRFFVLTLIFVYGFAQITEYSNLKPIVSDLTAKLLSESQDMGGANPQLLEGITQQCQNTDKIVIPVGSESITIDCKEVQAKRGSALPQYLSDAISNVVLKDYYKDYGCSPVGCLTSLAVSRDPTKLPFLISAQMNQFLKMLIPYLVIGLVLSLFILIYFIRETFSVFKEVGMTLLSAGVPFVLLLLLKYRELLLVSTGILSGKEDFLLSANELLSGPVNHVTDLYLYMYGIVFIIGAVLAITGYVVLRQRAKAAGTAGVK
ncbi:hypothetical protein [Candidatus Methanoperedens nitratireducens]|uniref:hypothetical protein n=1 Tax=Candidatus Methanoperedens nitratireducens TaxID=1392998 RepID=UPI000BB74D02|nr:hypothetical protein [Candidatus Methanoperedens nitroreducens]